MKATPKPSAIQREAFIAFCEKLLIPAKEGSREVEGTLIPFIPIRTQIYVLDQILEGLKRGIHFFVILKCRQSGITTLCLAFLLYWLFKHDGVIFHFIADTSKRVNYNRKLIKDFVKSLGPHKEWRQEVEEDNRDMISFVNRSCLIWNNGNSRDEGGLGRGTGVMGCHITEMARIKDEQGMASLFSSFSHRNPVRLYLVEGTAEGPGMYKDLYEEAEGGRNTSMEAIFVGWWLHPEYDLDLKNPEDLARYKTYWEPFPKYDRDEAPWVEAVEQRYGWKISPTQMGWWRYHLKELKFDNLELMYQEYPPLPEYAWRYGGANFITTNKLIARRSYAEQWCGEKHYFQFVAGDTFAESDFVRVDPREKWYDLVTYFEPCSGRGVRYVVGVDPAHGATETGDHACIEVWRAYSDKCVQVAEFVRKELPTYQLAWALLHLCGTYNAETLINMELQGGGQPVSDEILRVQSEYAKGYDPALMKYFQNLRYYLYTRPDAVRKSYASFHWRTTPDNKITMQHHFRDFFERGLIVPLSLDLIKEAEGMNLLRNGEIETGREDHRLMATCLVIMAYIQCIELDIGGSQYTEEYFTMEQKGIDGKLGPSEILTNNILKWRDGVLAAEAARIVASKSRPKWYR